MAEKTKKTRWESTGDLMSWMTITCIALSLMTLVPYLWDHRWLGISQTFFGLAVVNTVLMGISFILHVIQKRLQRSE